MTYRMYGKRLEEWIVDGKTEQIEVAYKDIDVETGEVRGIGSEDFSMMRWHQEIAEKWVWTWDGDRRNRGGHRWFECHGMIYVRKSETRQAKRFLQSKYDAVAIELR